MSTMRRAARLEGNFYMLDKSISEDKELSWAARGMLIYLLGKPDNWEVSIQNLINQTEGSRTKSGRDAVRALLKELSSAGYIRKCSIKAQDGKFAGYDYEVTEYKRKSTSDQPETDYPSAVKPETANPQQISIEVLTRTEEQQPKPTKADYSALFDAFWKAYPKKVAKDAAAKAFAKRKPDDKMLKDILQAVELQKTTEQWQKDGGQYIPNPATWLNQGRWMDEIECGGNSGCSAFPGMI